MTGTRECRQEKAGPGPESEWTEPKKQLDGRERNKVGTIFRKKEGSKQETRERGGRYRADKGWTPDYRKQQREVDRIDREGNRAGM